MERDHQEEQKKEELDVFLRFATVCDLCIDARSVKKCKEQRPDILCRTKAGKPIAFELTEILGSHFSNLTKKQHYVKTSLDDFYDEKLHKDKKEKFLEFYSNASISVNFK